MAANQSLKRLLTWLVPVTVMIAVAPYVVDEFQEMTLTFVPKILVIFVSLLVLMPFMLSTLADFTQSLFTRIASG